MASMASGPQCPWGLPQRTRVERVVVVRGIEWKEMWVSLVVHGHRLKLVCWWRAFPDRRRCRGYLMLSPLTWNALGAGASWGCAGVQLCENKREVGSETSSILVCIREWGASLSTRQGLQSLVLNTQLEASETFSNWNDFWNTERVWRMSQFSNKKQEKQRKTAVPFKVNFSY